MRDFLVHLHPVLREAYLFGHAPNDMPMAYQPDRYFTATATAAFILRNNRLQADGGQPLSDTFLPDLGNGDTYRRLLYTMVNQSIEAAYADAPLTSDLPVRRSKAYESTCLQSDILFGEAVRTLTVPECNRSRGLWYGVRLITDQKSQPLLLQKIAGDRSSKTALSLQPLTLEGITYPPGSILGVHVARDQKQTGRYEPYVPFGEVQKVPASEVVGADFLRPSLLMGTIAERDLRIGERLESGRYENRYEAAVKIITTWSMADVVNAAALA